MLPPAPNLKGWRAEMKKIVVPLVFKGKEEITESIILSRKGIFLEKKTKQNVKYIALSNRKIKKIVVCEEPEPYSNGRFLRIVTPEKEYVGGPDEIAAQLSYLHRDKLAQALSFHAYFTKEIEIAPKFPGFYLIDNKIVFYGNNKKIKSSLDDDIEFIEKILYSYPNPSKFALVMAFMVSSFLTPVRKALHVECPGLLVRGEKATGKTTFCETVLYGLLEQVVESGQSIATVPRFARIANTNILTVVDEAEKLFANAARYERGIIEIFKLIHTTSAIARTSLTKNREPIVDFARSGFVYVINPLTVEIDEAMQRRLIVLTLDKSDSLKKRHTIPRRLLPALFERIVNVIEQNSKELVALIKNETTHKAVLDTGLFILNLAELKNVARLAEEMLGEDLSLQAEDVFTEESSAVAELKQKISQILRGCKDLREVQNRIKQHNFEGLYMDQDDNICICRGFVAGMRNKISLARLAELLREDGIEAVYSQLWLKGKNFRSVKIPASEILPDIS